MKIKKEDPVITHYGMLGMRWGVRKARYTDENASGIKLEKGSKISRVASEGDEQLGGMKYAAFTPEDIDEYKFALGGNEKYLYEYKLKEALVSPNEKHQVDAFLETVSEMKVSNVARILKTKSKLSTLKDIEKELKKAVENGEIKSQIKTYDKFMELFYAKELEPIRSRYFEKLSQEGYNMIIDSSDRGVVADNPIIIFSGSRSLSFESKKAADPFD
jgi:ribosomal protein S20